LVEIVLRVNDRIATRYDYEDRKAARIEAIANQPNLSTEERRKLANEAGKAVAREMFEELLLLSRGDELRIRPTEAQIEAAIEATRERMGLRDPEEFRAALEATGWTLEEFRRRLRVQLVTSEVVDREVRSKLKLDDDLLVRRYQAQPERWQRPERRRIVELVVREEAFNGNLEEARKVAEQVAALWRAGNSESEILKEFDSKGVSGPVEHGWVASGELAPELETVAFRLEAGGVSDPVFARGVLHVLRVSDIEPAGRIPFAEVKDRLRAEEGRRLLEERLQSYLQELASRAYVVDRLPPEAQGFRDLGSRPEMDEALSLLKPERKAAPAEGSGVASENPSPEGSPPNTP
jgi:parvulin-like peptidyl-prolyl isomerase